MNDATEHDLSEESTVAWQPRPWWIWCSGLMVTGVLTIAWAGALLSGSELGTSLRARSCDGGALGAVAVLAAGAVLVLLGATMARLSHHGALLAWDPHPLRWTLPVPVLLLAVTLPGVAGCRAAATIANVAVVGSALVGASGLVLAGTAAALLAAALAGTVVVSWGVPSSALAEEPAGIVERAIQDAEAFRAEGAGERFHGVDPLD